MIPTMMLVGFVVGALVHDDRSLVRSLILGVGSSVLWGIVVAVGASSLIVFVGGTGLGLANVAVGAVPGWGFRAASRAVGEHVQPR